MNKEKEKIEMLKYLSDGIRTRLDIYQKSGLDWDVLSELLFEMKEDGLSISLYHGFAHWQITSAGIAAIKKWDREGTPGKLFKDKK